LSPEFGDRIIEIGAIALERDLFVEEFHSLVAVKRSIAPEAKRIHGITEDMLCGQPRTEQVMPLFHRFIGDSLLIAHCAEFDMRFIGIEFARLKLGLRNAFCCTLEIGRKLLPELPRHDLKTLYRALYGKSPNRLHRALDDARAAAEVWVKLSRSFSHTTRTTNMETIPTPRN